MQVTRKEFQYGDQTVVMETGRLARQADAAVRVDVDDTSVLVSVVGVPIASAEQSFFPLTVNYQERTYAAGKIPGSFFKREGRPSEKETLTSRLIDRPLRPLFPKGFMNEVQVIATVVSLNPQVNADIPALLGASAALNLSGIPFHGPLAAARVAYCDGAYVLNPTGSMLLKSDLNLVMAATKESIIMVESEAKFLSEEQMLDALVYGHENVRTAIAAIEEFTEQAGAKEPWDWQAALPDRALVDRLEQSYGPALAEAYQVPDKVGRKAKLSTIHERAIAELGAENGDGAEAKRCLAELEKKIVRNRILDGEKRIDGRATDQIRSISTEVRLLPRPHGSALFTRGETQVLAAVTLGNARDAQRVDAIEGEYKERFMLHYNFPPYSVGEVGFMGSPKRREIGHGRLAKRGLLAVMPEEEEFPYVIRVVAEVTESNGSSSMATICATSMALMDAGVPVAHPVAGIAMGLIVEGQKYAVLSDILGDEDHLGDMDFKVAGSERGITALQMDVKSNVMTPAILSVALQQAKEGRLHILKKMAETIGQANQELSPYAPRLLMININPSKIRDVIGKGGSTIRALTEETGAVIDVGDSGQVTISAVDQESAQQAKARIEELTAEVEEGQIYEGTVRKLTDFGAFVNILPGKDGLVHISQISTERITNVSDYLGEGERIKVKVLGVDRSGRISLTIKNLN